MMYITLKCNAMQLLENFCIAMTILIYNIHKVLIYDIKSFHSLCYVCNIYTESSFQFSRKVFNVIVKNKLLKAPLEI